MPLVNIQDIMTLILAIFASSGFWAVITLILQNKYSKDNKLSEDQLKMNHMVLGLAHERIITLGMSYIDRGYVTNDEYEDLVKYLYKPYKDLGGNGTAELVVDRVKKLPIHQLPSFSGDES